MKNSIGLIFIKILYVKKILLLYNTGYKSNRFAVCLVFVPKVLGNRWTKMFFLYSEATYSPGKVFLLFFEGVPQFTQEKIALGKTRPKN